MVPIEKGPMGARFKSKRAPLLLFQRTYRKPFENAPKNNRFRTPMGEMDAGTGNDRCFFGDVQKNSEERGLLRHPLPQQAPPSMFHPLIEGPLNGSQGEPTFP